MVGRVNPECNLEGRLVQFFYEMEGNNIAVLAGFM